MRIFRTFNENAEYQEKYKGPIHSDTVLTLDPKTGDIIRGWGNQTFYLPHGIHIDSLGNIWLTDIALHQVFKVRREIHSKAYFKTRTVLIIIIIIKITESNLSQMVLLNNKTLHCVVKKQNIAL